VGDAPYVLAMVGRLTAQQWQVVAEDVAAAQSWPTGSVVVVSAGPLDEGARHDLRVAVSGMTGRRCDCDPDTVLVLLIAGRELRAPVSWAAAHEDLERAMRQAAAAT
jgi:hypothetical protein